MPDWGPGAITWLLSTFVGSAVAYAAIKSQLENLATRLKKVEDEISLLRARSHDHSNAVLRLDGRLLVLEDRDK